MPVPTAITDLSQTASSNYPAGTDSPSDLDNVQRAHASFIALLRDGKGTSTPVSLASATTTDIGAQNSPFVEISGTTTITGFGTNYTGVRFLRFGGILTLTHNASSLILPTAANITTAANDTAIAVPAQSGSGWAVISYIRASGQALVSATDFLNTTRIDVASATTVNLTSGAPNTRHINITGTTQIDGFTVVAGLCYFVRFNAALNLTNNAAIITQTGATITTAAGDTCILRATASNTVEVLAYSPAGLLPANTNPLDNGTAAVGTSLRYARQDHVHENITLNSSVATTSGTSVSLTTSIPAAAKRVSLFLSGVSTNGTSLPIVQLGDSGGIEASGYTSLGLTVDVLNIQQTTGFGLTGSWAASDVLSGAVIFSRVNTSHTWLMTFQGDINNTNFVLGTGRKTLSATLDRISITTVAGTDAFDAGSIVVAWE